MTMTNPATRKAPTSSHDIEMRTDAGRTLFSRLWAADSYSEYSKITATVQYDITLIEAQASQLSEPRTAELVEALRDLAPHILVDGTRCYCSIFGEWWEYDDREHDEKCAAARRALAATDPTTPAPEPDEYLCPNCVTPWKCNGPHIPQGESTQVDESGSSKRHMRQSINGCVTCPRPWSGHTAAERGEPPVSQSGSSEPSVTIRDLEIIVATVLDDTEEGNEIEHQIVERARACSARAASPKGEPASAQAVAPGLDDMEGALHYALGHMSDECECDHIWDGIRKFHALRVAPLPAYAEADQEAGE